MGVNAVILDFLNIGQVTVGERGVSAVVRGRVGVDCDLASVPGQENMLISYAVHLILSPVGAFGSVFQRLHGPPHGLIGSGAGMG